MIDKGCSMLLHPRYKMLSKGEQSPFPQQKGWSSPAALRLARLLLVLTTRMRGLYGWKAVPDIQQLPLKWCFFKE
jgi:hypothetical protein